MQLHGPDAAGIAEVPLVSLAPSPQDHPSKYLYVIGVTGTNGKTTVSYLIGEALKLAGLNPFVLGTLNSGSMDLTTPEPLDISEFMSAHLDQGGTHFVMEVTSEGIDQERISSIDFDVKILTNITQDHLDYHKTYERYEKTKLDFMSDGRAHKIYPKGFQDLPIDFATRLLGRFNLLNIKAAVSVLRHTGVSEFHIQKALSSCLPPRGRMERIDKGQAFMVLVDYAHTPNGLENVLTTLKEIAISRNGRLLVLFGCGGNRDRGKRPLMGNIASQIADQLVITDDNPRDEDGQTIMAEILVGIDPDFDNYILIQDRRTAIKYLIGQSQPDDVVLLAGKGHETSQINNSETIYFDDRDEAANAISMQEHTIS